MDRRRLDQVPVCRIHQHETKQLCEKGPRIAFKKGTHLGQLNEGERARETQAAHSLLTLPRSAREVGVLKQDGVGNGENELGIIILVLQTLFSIMDHIIVVVHGTLGRHTPPNSADAF